MLEGWQPCYRRVDVKPILDYDHMLRRSQAQPAFTGVNWLTVISHPCVRLIGSLHIVVRTSWLSAQQVRVP